MAIQKVKVEGFRLLQDVEILLESDSTVVVGRNNSGKTSLTDVFDRFASDHGSRFRLEDFSVGVRKKFFEAKQLRDAGASPTDVLAALPKIVLTLTFGYDPAATDLGPLSLFIIDVETSSTVAIAKVEYAPTLSSLTALFDVPAPPAGVQAGTHFLRCLRDTLSKGYSIQVSAIDPTDPSNMRRFEGAVAFQNLMQCNFVRAQRTLDHSSHGDADVIGKLLSTLFKTATAPTAAAADQALAAQLKTSVEGVERSMQGDFDEMLKGLLPAMDVLGFPGLNDTEIRPETSLNVESLLSDHTKVVYTGHDGVHLPEGYNGLGTRNLIFMLLQLASYHKAYRGKLTRPVTHLIFIEEPEAHLHPQMQKVFIQQLKAAVLKLSEKYPGEPIWQVQFVITTHSSHVANAAPFDAIRYFLNELPREAANRHTKIKDFKKGLSKVSPEDQNFLHQYMTLTKCDLYFADKAILIEGATERILMPRLCELVDRSLPESKRLARQYVTSVEVGGAHAHLFYPLLDFLELKTLVIADLDSVHPVEVQTKKGEMVTRWLKCPVATERAKTANTAIREWFRPKRQSAEGEGQATSLPELSMIELAAKTAADKQNGYRRLAYQIPETEGSPVCARSYEDALVLANPDRFDWPKEEDEAMEAWNIAQGLQKAETALRFAIREVDWTVPRYIAEGLVWLVEPPPPASPEPPAADPEAASATISEVSSAPTAGESE